MATTLSTNHETEASTLLEVKLVIATRLHLGKASTPPSPEKIQSWIVNLQIMADSVNAQETVIAVDATPKVKDYDFVQAVKEQIQGNQGTTPIHVLPVTPWGRFVPALNALILYAQCTCQADQILFVSAEVSASAKSIQILSQHCSADKDVLVAGANLQGHDYQHKQSPSNTATAVELTGRTCPWNTLAVWNLERLSLTGFLPVSDVSPTMAGVEECVAIAIHQKLFPNAKAMLVNIPTGSNSDIEWKASSFEQDEERRKWHEQKMQSKLERAAHQMKQLELTGTVEHC